MRRSNVSAKPGVSRLLASVWFCFLLLALPSGIHACQICYSVPKVSAADRLIQSDVVVLAREDPDRPFHLASVEVIKGESAGPEIDLFLDTSTRTLLEMNPDRRVVCVYHSDEGWVRVGVTNEAFGPLVRDVLRRAPEWEENPEARPRFFTDFLNHEDDQMATLARLEVARAPYDQLRQFGGVLTREEIYDFLGNFRYIEWHPLYILLLAQSAHSEDHEWIEEKARSAAQFSLTKNLSAWATAWVEVAEEDALAFYEEHYFANPNRSFEEMQAILLTLSVHGNRGHIHLRDRIGEGYRTILSHHPALASAMVSDLTEWERWDLAEDVREAVATDAQNLTLTARGVIRVYLEQAAAEDVKAVAPVDIPPKSSPFALWWLIPLMVLSMLVALSKWRRQASVN